MNYAVKDVVYKVINHYVDGLTVGQFQILRIMRHGRLICFRTDKSEYGKAQHSFYPTDVSDSPERAVEKFHEDICGKMYDLYEQIARLKNLLEMSVTIWNFS